MNSKSSKSKRPTQQAAAPTQPKATRASSWQRLSIVGVALLWFIATTSIASRVHFVMGYGTLAAGPAQLEPLLASNSAWAFAMCAMGVWCWLAVSVSREASASVGWAVGFLLLALVPTLAAMLLRIAEVGPPPSYWEPLWLSGWSGISFAWLVSSRPAVERIDAGLHRWDVGLILLGVCAGTLGWTWQSIEYYSNFLLGYNDFGHFAQRVANTAGGNGVLLESPVLPMFWDHFNPGLLLLVPLWTLFPSVEVFFVLQALSLASGAFLVWAIARRQQLGHFSSLLFGLAWLTQPVLGQMNLAYTYGWHPISLAIPLMLAALWALLAQRAWIALLLAILAMSMEEGVIVVVCLFCAANAAQCLWPLRPRHLDWSTSRAVFGISSLAWLILAVTSGIAFVLVYRWSGLAEFQTARFVSLGGNAWEVLLSPVLRPSVFWGSLLRWDKFYFVLSLWLPCFLPGLLRGWRVLLATILPLLVLLVWDHRPASSLAFQYTSTLLPLFWLATIRGSQPSEPTPGNTRSRSQLRAPSVAVGALATCMILSLYVGQLSYSSPTLRDVIAVTYGPHDEQRRATDTDGRWLTEQLQQIRSDGTSVLATGRIAAHLVGNRDVETVGQYLLRRPQLAALSDRLDDPIAHYRWIILDRREGFQQTASEIARVEAEARQAGFQVTAEEFDIVIMRR